LKVIKLDACWILSNITAGSDGHVGMFLSRKELIKKLLDMLAEEETLLKSEVITVFSNLGENCGDFQVEEFYVEQGVLESIVELLKEDEEQVVVGALRNLYNILHRAYIRDKAELITN
jgi:hypothetical protein